MVEFSITDALASVKAGLIEKSISGIKYFTQKGVAITL